MSNFLGNNSNTLLSFVICIVIGYFVFVLLVVNGIPSIFYLNFYTIAIFKFKSKNKNYIDKLSELNLGG